MNMERAYKQAKNEERRGEYEAADMTLACAREWRRRLEYAWAHGGYWEHESEAIPENEHP